jgi:hypothetical protein
MSGEAIYQKLCTARNLDAAVSRLSCGELAEVAETLSKMNPTGGVPAQVFGMVAARLGATESRRKTARRKTQEKK